MNWYSSVILGLLIVIFGLIAVAMDKSKNKFK